MQPAKGNQLASLLSIPLALLVGALALSAGGCGAADEPARGASSAVEVAPSEPGDVTPAEPVPVEPSPACGCDCSGVVCLTAGCIGVSLRSNCVQNGSTCGGTCTCECYTVLGKVCKTPAGTRDIQAGACKFN